MAIWDRFQYSIKQTWLQLADWLPQGLAAVAFLLVGFFIASLSRKLILRLLKKLRVEELSIRSGVDDFLVQGGVRFTVVSLIGNVFFWMILFFAFAAALHTAGLEAASTVLHRIFLYVPALFTASLILIFGVMIARIIRASLFAFLNNIKFENAGPISALVYYIFLFLVTSMALEELQIGVTIVTSAFQMAFGSFCVAFALAFGLGGRKWAADIINKHLRR